jgi:predicted nucleic acid-binding protein
MNGCAALLLTEELAAQEALFPSDSAIPFGFAEAAVSARLYRSVRRPRGRERRPGGREIDLAIAAYAISRQAELWTLNASDFADIPGLRLKTAV